MFWRCRKNNGLKSKKYLSLYWLCSVCRKNWDQFYWHFYESLVLIWSFFGLEFANSHENIMFKNWSNFFDTKYSLANSFYFTFLNKLMRLCGQMLEFSILTFSSEIYITGQSLTICLKLESWCELFKSFTQKCVKWGF